MEAAIAEAKSNLKTFISALERGKKVAEDFTIKKGYKYGKDGVEYIWINEVKLTKQGFEGKINNKPVNKVKVKLGQTVQVKQDEVVDWMFTSDGKLQGGYTIVALTYGTPDMDYYEKFMGIDWSKYMFLRKRKFNLRLEVSKRHLQQLTSNQISQQQCRIPKYLNND